MHARGVCFFLVFVCVILLFYDGKTTSRSEEGGGGNGGKGWFINGCGGDNYHTIFGNFISYHTYLLYLLYPCSLFYHGIIYTYCWVAIFFFISFTYVLYIV